MYPLHERASRVDVFYSHFFYFSDELFCCAVRPYYDDHVILFAFKFSYFTLVDAVYSVLFEPFYKVFVMNELARDDDFLIGLVFKLVNRFHRALYAEAEAAVLRDDDFSFYSLFRAHFFSSSAFDASLSAQILSKILSLIF